MHRSLLSALLVVVSANLVGCSGHVPVPQPVSPFMPDAQTIDQLILLQSGSGAQASDLRTVKAQKAIHAALEGTQPAGTTFRLEVLRLAPTAQADVVSFVAAKYALLLRGSYLYEVTGTVNLRTGQVAITGNVRKR